MDYRGVDSLDVKLSFQRISGVSREEGYGSVSGSDIEDTCVVGKVLEKVHPEIADLVVVVARKCIGTGMQRTACPVVAPGFGYCGPGFRALVAHTFTGSGMVFPLREWQCRWR